MGVVATAATAVAGAIGSITAGIGGAVATGLGALGIGAETAAAIGGIAGPAIFGAGTGALGSAVTGGDPLKGALLGGVLGGVGGALSGGAPSLGGMGQGADLIPGNGLVSSPAGSAAASGGVDAGAWDTGAAGAGSSGAATAPSGGALNALSSNSAAIDKAADAESAGGGKGGVLGSLGISNPALALGALSAASSFFNKPTQGGYALPTPASTASNAGNFNQPLAAPGTFTGATPVNPNVSNWYTYGQIPGGAQFFNNNSAAAYGFARGGGTEQEFSTGSGNHRVRGPGSETSDSIPARLSNNEYVMDAEDMRRIGGGSPERGAKILDRERKRLDKGGGALSQLGRAA